MSMVRSNGIERYALPDGLEINIAACLTAWFIAF